MSDARPAEQSTEISWSDFERVDIRVGRIVSAGPNARAIKPAYQLTIDFGLEVGLKRSSAQLVANYTAETLVGRLVVAVVNFPPRQVAGVKSEVLVLGIPDEHGAVVLLQPEREVPLGGKMY